jgi:hypothetical protein
MPEQLALHQIAWDRAAVDRHERAVGAVAGVVDGLGEQFLAGAAFAEDQGGGFTATGDTPRCSASWIARDVPWMVSKV